MKQEKIARAKPAPRGIRTLAVVSILASSLLAGSAWADGISPVHPGRHSKKHPKTQARRAKKTAKNAKTGQQAQATAQAQTQAQAKVVPTSDTLQSSAASPIEPTSIATGTPGTSKLSDKFVFYDYSMYYGGNPVAWNASNPGFLGASAGGDQNIDNGVVTAYKLTPDTYLGLQTNFNWVPVNGPQLNSQQMILEDPNLKFAMTKLIHTDRLNLYVDGRLYLPAQSYAQYTQIAEFRSVQVLTYEIKGTPWTLGSYGSLRYYAYQNANPVPVDTFIPALGMVTPAMGPLYKYRLRAYIGPNVNYQLTPKLSIFVLGEMEAAQMYGTNMYTWVNLTTDIEPGVMWDVSPHVTVNPYVNIYPTNGQTWQTLFFGANLLIKFI